MKRFVLCLFVLSWGCAFAQQAPKRPKITGIDHVDFYTTDAAANRELYAGVLSLPLLIGSHDALEPRQIQRFVVGDQWVGYSPAPDAKFTDRMDHIAFRTENCAELRSYLGTKGVKASQTCIGLADGGQGFMVDDPEGHRIEFVQVPTLERLQGPTCCPVSRRLIHAGFIVHDRDAEDHFYKDILGFHLYWQGGMKAGQTDWVAMQVPDGTDWLEYMLNVEANPDLGTSGVMNHISLGVSDMKAAQTKLEGHGWKPHGDEHSQMGKDGKWQLNLFDPDQTRIELMEFTPKEKPCCSEFKGKHPSEKE
jgi:catechol 2,3-dioxygenase-like lactoylglutathione lyase family enzyme